MISYSATVKLENFYLSLFSTLKCFAANHSDLVAAKPFSLLINSRLRRPSFHLTSWWAIASFLQSHKKCHVSSRNVNVEAILTFLLTAFNFCPSTLTKHMKFKTSINGVSIGIRVALCLCNRFMQYRYYYLLIKAGNR